MRLNVKINIIGKAKYKKLSCLKIAITWTHYFLQQKHIYYETDWLPRDIIQLTRNYFIQRNFCFFSIWYQLLKECKKMLYIYTSEVLWTKDLTADRPNNLINKFLRKEILNLHTFTSLSWSKNPPHDKDLFNGYILSYC